MKEKIGKMWKENLPGAPAAGRSVLGESVGKMKIWKLIFISLSMSPNQVLLYPQQHVYPNLKAAVPKAVRTRGDVITLGEDEFA